MTGTVQVPPNTNFGVVVNGIVALVDANNRFYANNVPLIPGSNTITVTATMSDGTAATQTIVVISSGSSPIDITADPESGIAPLMVRFSVRNNHAQAISRIDLDADGDGTIDASTTDALAVLSYTYSTPDIYLSRMTVTLGSRVFTQNLVVAVSDAQQMDRLFNTLWSGMNDALVRGDITTALTYLNASARRKYQRVFTALLAQMPQIVASYSPLRRVSISASIGEYAINRTINGRNKIFLIYFLQDADGVWRLDAM